jgi:aspartyl-tRNA(Asn)/glutamyl-tRNA(Gln) amidotransferase subunit A
VYVDETGALAAARERDAEAGRGRFRGPLHGVPVGIKDIFHVAGLRTGAGAGGFAHEMPVAHAVAVARLLAAGAIVLGKTATTEFAYMDPAPTRNPWNRDHTPGGSSSGSAAAVAAAMVPLALGTQTVGSVLRPAGYCGVVGVKPTYGVVPTEGVIPLAWSLDHVGCFARTVGDAVLALGVLADRPLAVAPAPPRIGVPQGWVSRAAGEVATHVGEVALRLAEAGATVEATELPASVAGIEAAGRLVMAVEAAAYHTARFGADPSRHGPGVAGLIRAGRAVSGLDYVQADRARAAFRQAMTPVFDRYTVLLTPVAPTPAPPGLSSTGDPSFCAPWSFIGAPALALPSGMTATGLPLAVQLVAGVGRDTALLGAAGWCERVLGPAAVALGSR